MIQFSLYDEFGNLKTEPRNPKPIRVTFLIKFRFNLLEMDLRLVGLLDFCAKTSLTQPVIHLCANEPRMVSPPVTSDLFVVSVVI